MPVLSFPGDCATPLETAAWCKSVAEEEWGLPGVLPIMASCVELTSAWTSEGCLSEIPGYNYAVDHDSLGLWQQRPSAGWGSVAQLQDPEYALRAFLREASKYQGSYDKSDPSELGAWCATVQRPLAKYEYLYAEKGYPIAQGLLDRLDAGDGGVVKPSAIVEAAYRLLGVHYRMWYVGDPLPMWRKDGYEYNTAPPVSYMQRVGVMCSDLVNYALCANGLEPGYGTEAFADYLTDQQPFDPSTPGEPGAICLRPYSGPALEDQGHIGIYVGEHTIIQALVSSGVTDAYTDEETYGWGGATSFTLYGRLPGVDYGGDAPVPEPVPTPEDVSTWRQYGWWEFESESSWNLRHREP